MLKRPKLWFLVMAFMLLLVLASGLGAPVTAQGGALTRRALAQFLAVRFKLPQQWPSRFAYLSDVPLSDPDFAPIDACLSNHLLFAHEATGAFEPNRPATRLDLWLAVSKVLFPTKKLSPSQTQALLQGYEGAQQLTPYEARRVAILFLSGILSAEQGDVPLQPQQPLDEATLRQLLANLEASKLLLKPEEAEAAEATAAYIKSRALGYLPQGLTLKVSPLQAMVGARLQVGASYLLELLEPVVVNATTTLPIMLPKGSVLATTLEASAEQPFNTKLWTLSAQRITLPSTEQYYQLQARTQFSLSTQEPRNLVLSPGSTLALVAGDVLTFQTQAPLIP